MIKDYFTDVRRDVERLRDVLSAIEEGGDGLTVPNGNGHSGGISDPTAAQALARGRRLRSLQFEASQLKASIANARVLIDGVRAMKGDLYGGCMERYYLELETVREIAEDLGVSKSTVHGYIMGGCSYIDRHGIAAVKSSRVEKSMKSIDLVDIGKPNG